MGAFENNLTEEQKNDPRYAFRVFMIHKTANRAPGADLAVELIRPGSDVAEKFTMALKEVEKKKFLPTDIVKAMQSEGFIQFTVNCHTKLWKHLKAKEPAKGYGAVAVGKQWCWYATWMERVREECEGNRGKYS